MYVQWLKCKPSANCACAILLIDGLGYLYTFTRSSSRRVWHGLVTVVDSMRESMHAIRCDLLCLQDTLQVGVGIPVGCESIVHSVVRRIFFNYSTRITLRTPSWFLQCLQLSRPCVYVPGGAVSDSFHGCMGRKLLQFPTTCILETTSSSAIAEFNREILWVPYVLLSLSTRLLSRSRGKFQSCLLTHGTLCDSLSDIGSAVAIIESVGPSRGLILNNRKSLLFIPADASPSNHTVPPEVPIFSDGFELLGSPIGPSSYCESSVLKRVNKIQEALINLRDLHDSQMEAILLRSCLSLPKFPFAYVHVPRTSFDLHWKLSTTQLGRLYLTRRGVPSQTGHGCRLPSRAAWEAWIFTGQHYMLQPPTLVRCIVPSLSSLIFSAFHNHLLLCFCQAQPQVIYRHNHRSQVFLFYLYFYSQVYLFVVVYKLVISVSMYSHHGKSVYQVSLLEDQP